MTAPPPNDATARQVQAADPAHSTWLSANAGSGKTRVLTDRVARLLLDGTDPTRVLCLTYTKAAATEMQNRLFRTLGEWAMLPDPALRLRLAELGVEAVDGPTTLAEARRLFARAIETPGGLRIQTIHSFCSSLLRRFPLEAGISPGFSELDERAGSLMMDEIVSEMADALAPDVIAALADCLTAEDFSSVTQSVAANRRAFGKGWTRDQWLAHFGLPAGHGATDVLAEVFLGGEDQLIAGLIPHLRAGSTTDEKAAKKLMAADFTLPTLSALGVLESVLLTGGTAKQPFSAKTGSFPTKATRVAIGPMADQLDRLMLRVEAARPRRLALETAEKTHALHRFADVFLAEYQKRKAARAVLDFDDLISLTVALLTDQAVAQWVLFRLDGGIDHILVDEAQDTSPLQWRVIELLAREFTAGQGARDVTRTIFVVGDKKQSIYSFQGADLQAFDQMQAHFRTRFAEIGQPILPMELEYSFRSSPAVLSLVDKVFAPYAGQGLGGHCHHIAFRHDMPGCVELWPLVPATGKDAPEEWWNPVDMIDEEHHIARLARQIAERIGAMLAENTPIPVRDGFRPAHAGDFLILVRSRSPLFAEIIRACKKAGLPIAGADRLRLGGELAVKDLAALLSFLATSEDDLSLAAALRSPLFGWSEQALFRLAYGRPGYLWQALRAAGDDHPETLSVLQDLRDHADFLRPYDLIERILTRHDGRRKLLARLGPEAEDGIDELLSQALSYEQNDVPSLTGFLGWLQTDDVMVKRQMDAEGHQIRVMTVHGAKGLEAPIVILPDTADRQKRERGTTLELEDGTQAWRMPKDQSPPTLAAARSAREAREEEERLRLLYVALTRAQSRLIVCGAGEAKTETAWYALVKQGMLAAGARPGVGGSLVLEHGSFPELGTVTPSVAPVPPPLPDWTGRRAPTARHGPLPVSPSSLPGAKILPGESEGDLDAALARGSRLHLLLEHLPRHRQEDWAMLSSRLLNGAEDSAELLQEAAAILTKPALSHLFGPGTLAEAPVTADLNGERMFGLIDRLVVTPTHVLAVDYKSNRITPADASGIPDGIKAQLLAYRSALAQIYPDRQVEVAVLWTKTADLMTVVE